jgi:alpha-beta hydrolase superfamily lysophospholipase
MPIVKSDLQTRIIDVRFSADNLILRGKLHLPPTQKPPVVIGSHGLYSSGNSPKQIALAEACNRAGLAFFRFDHRGCGGSQGEFEKVTTLEARCRDLKSAVEVIRRRADTGRHIGLFGSSMGGTVCICIARELTVSAMVIYAAPIRSRILDKRIRKPETSNSGGIFFDLNRQPFDISDQLASIRNILIIHGDADEIVPLSHAREIYNSVGQPKKLIVQSHGNHPMSNPEHQEAFIREATLWFRDSLLTI